MTFSAGSQFRLANEFVWNWYNAAAAMCFLLRIEFFIKHFARGRCDRPTEMEAKIRINYSVSAISICF